VTATSNQLTAPARGLVAALRHSMSRDEFFAGLYILGCANGLLGRLIQSFNNVDGWTGAALGIDINVIVLFAAFAGVSALLVEKKDEIRVADLAVAVIFIGLVSLPIFPLSWVAVTGLSLYILLFANDGSSDRRRGALILLALTVPMLWSRLIFQFFAKLILDIDATLVAFLLGTDRVGNIVRFADNSGDMVVMPACSSLANMSLAFLCWVSITQWAKHRWSPMDIMWSLLACASVIAVNVTRISLMGVSRSHYEAIHSQWGDLVTSSVMLALMVGFSVLGARRELFARA
jgi:exosortase/archaeosortase family protein